MLIGIANVRLNDIVAHTALSNFTPRRILLLHLFFQLLFMFFQRVP